jgi:HlyD family secretion protein
MPTTLNQHNTTQNLSQGFNQRSSLVKELISSKPSFIIRWGIVIFFFIIALLGLLCWFIQYPDIVVTKAKLNSVNAPKQVITHSDGKLTKILITVNQEVKAGQLLAYMESLANPETVMFISNQIDSISNLINQNRTNEIVKYFPTYNNENTLKNLGELQQQYQTFIQSFITFKDFLNNGFYLRKKTMLQTDFDNIIKLHQILATQKTLLEQDLSLTNENYKANESLIKDKVISQVDFRNEKSKLISKQLSLPQINASIVSNESQQNEKRKEIADLENQILIQKNTFNQTLLTMQSQIQAWQYKYLLKAPVAGTVTFTGFFQESQEMRTGTSLFYVQPPNTTYFIEMQIPQYNFGKVKINQEVLLKFQAYPYEQYGSVIGKIEYINSTPSDSGYLAKVSMPYGFVTNYKKPLQFKNGLTAQAEIITENMRLLERFYNNLTKQIKR